jgi:magnesium transporter
VGEPPARNARSSVMTNLIDPRPWATLVQLVGAGDADRLEEFIETLSPGDSARSMARLSISAQTSILTTLPPETAADLIEDIPNAHATKLVEQLEPEDAAAIISEMTSHDAATLISDLTSQSAEALLAAMDPQEASDARRLAAYPAGTAGSLMVTEYLAYPNTATVGDVADDLQARAEEYAEYDIQYAYVISTQGILVGVLPLRDLLLVPRNRSIETLMIPEPAAVPDQTGLEELAKLFTRHLYFGLPVIDERGRLVGVVRRADVEQARVVRADDAYRKSQGIVGGEELRSMPWHRRASRRLSWLSVNVVLNVIAASVIAAYQDTIASVIALAVFLPIISDMSGCSGNQAVAVSMRELALGMVKPHELLYVWLKEVGLGLLNGAALGLLLGAVAYLWKGNAVLGLVVGGAMMLNTMVSVSIGGTVPLLLKRLKMDPALASGPILTTVTDMCGFFLVLSFATAALSWLT